MENTQELYLRISELAARSGTSKQLIHYYLKRGYLHQPIYKKGNQAFYDETHLQRLELINRCKKEKLALPFTIELWERTPGRIMDRENSKKTQKKKHHPETQTRGQIIEVATTKFLKKGYNYTSITEIMDAIGFTKTSFYYYFENKRDLYLTCLNNTFEAFGAISMEKIRHQKDPLRRMKLRLDAAHAHSQTFLTAINLLKESLQHEDEEERLRAEAILRNSWVIPSAKDLERGMESGLFRHLDSELCTLAMITIAETLAYRNIVKHEHGGEAIVKTVFDIILYGILNHPNPLAISDDH